MDRHQPYFWVIPLTMFLVAGTLLIFAGSQAGEIRSSPDGTERVGATITELRHEKHMHGDSDKLDVMAFFRYEVDGSEFIELGRTPIGTRVAGEPPRLTHNVGDRVTLLVDPENPREIELASSSASWRWVAILGIGGAALLLASLWLGYRMTREPESGGPTMPAG